MSFVNRPILSASSVSKSYGEFVVLRNASLSVQNGEKIGIVGPNGIGKTTLLKILIGTVEPDSGRVSKKKGAIISYVPQDMFEKLDMTGREYLGSADISVLAKLRLDSKILDKKIRELSGGEKTKLSLSRIMAAEGDIVVLDEPTNSLDIPALEMLERYVLKSSKTFLIVSHDRRFLDATVSRVFEIDEFKRDVRAYDGGFTHYMEERRRRIEIAWKHYYEKEEEASRLKKTYDKKVGWMKEIERKRLGIRKLHPKLHDKPDDAMLRDKEAKAGKRARVMKDRLERFQAKTETVEKPREFLPLEVRFEFSQRSGDKVFSAKGIVKKMGAKIIGPISLEARFGERILVTGQNGSGKTTLLKMLLGKLSPDSGEVEAGSSLSVGYLPQEERFDPNASVLETFLSESKADETLGRMTLNRFRLASDDMKKKIGELSSGERSRLILAILMARKVNCLVLDEPSNHLDLEALESLESALKEFAGTLIAVSHDRYFVEQVGFSRRIAL